MYSANDRYQLWLGPNESAISNGLSLKFSPKKNQSELVRSTFFYMIPLACSVCTTDTNGWSVSQLHEASTAYQRLFDLYDLMILLHHPNKLEGCRVRETNLSFSGAIVLVFVGVRLWQTTTCWIVRRIYGKDPNQTPDDAYQGWSSVVRSFGQTISTMLECISLVLLIS